MNILKIKYSLIVIVSIFFLSEVSLWLVNDLFSISLFRDPFVGKDKIMKTYRSQRANPIYFCDMIHLNDLGHQKLFSCLDQHFMKYKSFSPKELIFIGGSTTEGSDCGSTVRWTNLLAKKYGAKATVLAQGGENSTMQVVRLFKYLQKENPKNAIVLEGNWFNEVLNYRPQENARKLFLFKLHHTLIKYSWTYLLLNNLIGVIQNNNNNIITEFLTHQGAPVEILAGESSVEHDSLTLDVSNAINDFNLSFSYLNTLSSQYSFKVMVVGFPYLPNFYLNYDKKLDHFLSDEWIPLIKKEQDVISKKYQYDFVDTSDCFNF